MVLVIMLALLGVGFALWSDTLVIEGQVQTGEVDMAFSPCETNDPEDTFDPGYEKHVASCECALKQGELNDQADNGPDKLSIRVFDGYPSYRCRVTYDMTNIGSVPVHLYSVFEDYDPNALDVEQACVDEAGAPVELDHQLHPEESVDCIIDLHVLQPAPENETLWLHKEYWWGQFNEEVIRVEGGPWVFSGYGWGGWSCPAGYTVVGGGFEPPDATVEYSGPAQPGESGGTPLATYPVYPHYTYTPPETGWVVQNDNDSESILVFALCAGPVGP
jgi:predicted ribosomally synthesized peptide with SipW-like signal peptide